MRLTNVFSGRPAYYDRNPIQITGLFKENSAAAPHGNTVQFTYTVPTGRKAMVEAGHAMVTRITAAAPVGRVMAWVQPQSAFSTFCPIAQSQSNVLLANEEFNVGQIGVILAGTTLQGLDGDLGTGGTADEWEDALVLEFDA